MKYIEKNMVQIIIKDYYIKKWEYLNYLFENLNKIEKED